MKTITRVEAEKRNLIKLAKHHKKYCEGEDCTISLIIVLEMAKRAGLEFTQKEMEEFL